jgi:hypothetical protein
MHYIPCRGRFRRLRKQDLRLDHDTFLILIRMFSGGCPPTTIVSSNVRWDPHFLVAVGAALRQLREDRHLFVSSGGTIHNLYRNHWGQILLYWDSVAQPVPPSAWAIVIPAGNGGCDEEGLEGGWLRIKA